MKQKVISGSFQLCTDSGVANTSEITVLEPDICPHCHHALVPELVGRHTYQMDKKGYLCLTYLCASCHHPFLTFHSVPSYKIINLVDFGPKHFQKVSFYPALEKLSPSFTKIYNQALEAENMGLDEIAGMGYRRALEFLIKDLAIHENPADKEKIENMHLGPCINRYIDYPRLKDAATGAAWLGNDHAHYKKKYEDKELADLKDYLDACVAWVEVVLKTESSRRLVQGDQ